MSTPTRPICRYHGGKWKLAPWILSRLPAHRIYVEPFGGAASVLLQKERSYAEIYNDLAGEIVNLFRVARDHGDALVRAASLTPFARAEFVESYEETADPVEQARRTLVRSFMGFGSAAASRKATGFRANSNRSGTTPAHDWANFPDALALVVERLRGVTIENKDAMSVMAQHDSLETLFYVDPPYVAATRDGGSDYLYEMTDEDHRELAVFLRGLRGMVVVSGYHSALYDEIFGGWRSEEREAFADGARPRTEVLWFNGSAAQALDRAETQMNLLEEAA
jgi:DNA adenine methylase